MYVYLHIFCSYYEATNDKYREGRKKNSVIAGRVLF
jgi:hypothetical protein